MAYMTMSELTRRRPRNLSGLGGVERIKWSGGSAGQFNEQGIPYGTAVESVEAFFKDQAAQGLTWDGTAWVQQPVTTASIPATALVSTPPSAPAAIYIDPATGATVAAPTYQQQPAPYYPPQGSTPMYAPTQYPQPAPYYPQTAPPPSTIVPTEMVGMSLTSGGTPAGTPAAAGGLSTVPTWAWIAGAAVLGLGAFIMTRK